MTIARFKKILILTGTTFEYYHEVPLRKHLLVLAKSILKELFVKMVVCVIKK